jgi:hypothetical protein
MRAGTMFAALMFGLTLALVACPGGGTDPPPQPPAPPSPPSPPITTDVGTPVGNPVEGTMDANGGSLNEPTATVTVKALGGVFDSSAQVSIQPITNTLPGGIGLGTAITVGQPLKKPLIVRFGYAADDVDPGGLGLALQADDGSWTSLYPVFVDATKKTISAALPETLTASVSSPIDSSRIKPTAGLNPRRVVKYLSFFMKPEKARVAVGKSVTFTPWARVREQPECEKGTVIPGGPGEDDLATLPRCPKPVTNPYPFTNTKTGFVRSWEVVGAGNGTVQPTPPVGAVYTAPATVPAPNTVDVHFTSTFSGPGGSVRLTAPVRVVGDKWVGTFSNNSPGNIYEGRVEWKLEENAGNPLEQRFRPSGGSITITDFGRSPTCQFKPVTLPLTPADGSLVISLVDSTSTFDFLIQKTFTPSTLCPPDDPVTVASGGIGSLSQDDTVISGTDGTGETFNFTLN